MKQQNIKADGNMFEWSLFLTYIIGIFTITVYIYMWRSFIKLWYRHFKEEEEKKRLGE